MDSTHTYHAAVAESVGTRKWIWRGLLVSLLLHFLLFVFFQFQEVELFVPSGEEAVPPPRFVVNKVTIDPKLLEAPKEEKVTFTSSPSNTQIVVPDEKPELKVREMEVKPLASEISSPLLSDRPQTTPEQLESLARKAAQSGGGGEKGLGTLTAALLESSVKAPNQPVITLPGGQPGGDGSGRLEGIPGRKSIDDALAMQGAPLGADQPIAMPGGALFEHDQAQLRPQAVLDLKKLGKLVTLYPDADFIISGHTDWTGSDDYNQRLSERRAAEVKRWLVQVLGVDARRIQTLGKGSSEALVEADKDVVAQQPNRRVEIVIRPRRKG